MTHKSNPVPKAIVLAVAVLAMLPIAASWDNIFGSVQKAISQTISLQSAQEEKHRLQDEIDILRNQMEKLTGIIEEIEMGDE